MEQHSKSGVLDDDEQSETEDEFSFPSRREDPGSSRVDKGVGRIYEGTLELLGSSLGALDQIPQGQDLDPTVECARSMDEMEE